MKTNKGSKFKVGDIVRLKSGGPNMTVSEVRDLPDGPWLICAWFSGKKHDSNGFPPDTIEEVPAEENNWK